MPHQLRQAVQRHALGHPVPEAVSQVVRAQVLDSGESGVPDNNLSQLLGAYQGLGPSL